MKDNGILKYYRSGQFCKDGVLDIKKTDFIKSGPHKDVCKLFFRGKDDCIYYLKKADFLGEAEAEVLFGQVYNKAGLENAVYTPIDFDNGDKKWVVSNSVCDGEHKDGYVTSARRFLDQNDIDVKKVLFAKNNPHLQENLKHFTPEAIRDFALMTALDLGSYNVDRNLSNFFVKVDKESGQATNLVTIDNGICLDTFAKSRMKSSYLGACEFPDENYRPVFWEQHISDNLMAKRRTDLVEELKTNEAITEHISPHELAEKIGSLNIPEIARDIKDTIGFDVGKDVANAYDKSFYTLAEELEQ